MPNLSGYNANDHEPQSFDLLPDGNYDVVIVKSEMKPTKTGGEMLVLEFQVVGQKGYGRKLWDRLNLKNASKEAVKIANSTLSAICRAVGVMTPQDSAELHNKPLVVSVVKQAAKDGYDATNKIKSYKPLLATPPAVAAQQVVKEPPATPPDDNLPF